MTSAEARKFDILLALKKQGYNLVDGDQPELMNMSLGGGYTLECNVKKPTKEWKIIFNDGVETTEYPIDSEKVIHTYRGDSDKLIKDYNDELMTLFEDGVRATEEPEQVKEPPAKSPKNKEEAETDSWQPGGYKAKVIDAEYQVHSQPVRKPWRTIKGLTPRLAECGKIKIGKKGKMITSQKGTQFRPPQKLDHFEITTMEKSEDDDFIVDEVIMKKLGPNCKEISVILPYDDPSLNFPTSYAWYESAACKCRGDGELAETANHEIIKCDPDTCSHAKEGKCKPNGTLSVILTDAPTVGGVYKFRTVGWNSINNLFSSMELIRGLTNGFLAGLPLLLTLTPKHTTIPGKGTPVTIHMVNLVYRGSLPEMAKAIKQTLDTRALMQYSVKDFEILAEEALALPESPEECNDFIEEFVPEAVKI
jgi:hypothetical protein